MKRRDFITLLGGSAATWPVAARGQRGERVRRIGVQIGQAESDQQGQAFVAAFRDELRKLGWIGWQHADRYPLGDGWRCGGETAIR